MSDQSEMADVDFDAEAYLDRLAETPDAQIQLGEAAIALSALDHPGIKAGRYLHHLKVLGDDVAAQYQALLKEGKPDDLKTRLETLKDVLHGAFHYSGDRDTYEDLQNADLIRVIDRAKGLPVALSVLYITAARAQGWEIDGLDMPGHFVCRLEKDGERLMFDPFDDAHILEAPDLRRIIKKTLGEHAELSAEYYNPASNRDILMRLQNNIKYRQIEAEDYEAALKTVQKMQKVDSGEWRLLLDAGVLYARTGRVKEAIEALARYIEKAPDIRDRMEAELLLNQLNEQLD